jgi:hypothetical protein
MWRFTRNNDITEGFHRKMKLIHRRAYGFRNFHNYRVSSPTAVNPKPQQVTSSPFFGGEPLHLSLLRAAEDGGAMGIRTPDLLNAIEALYQLSYDPVNEGG